MLEYGSILYQLGNIGEAIRIFIEVTKENKNSAKAISNLITLYREKKEFDKALDIYNKCSNEVKQEQLVIAAYAYTLLAIEKTHQAISIYKKLIQQNPLNSLYWVNCCASFRAQKENESAIKAAKSGLIINPKSKLLKQALAQGYAEIGMTQQVRELVKEDLDDEEISQQHLFNIQFLGEGYNIIGSKDLARMALKMGKRITAKSPSNMHKDRIKEKIRNRKLRIGYLSADINSHPVGRFILPIIRNHDKEIFKYM